jgi:hypothetical protein
MHNTKFVETLADFSTLLVAIKLGRCLGEWQMHHRPFPPFLLGGIFDWGIRKFGQSEFLATGPPS